MALLSWWAGVGLAVVSYFWLTSVANQTVVITDKAGQLGTQITASLWQALAMGGRIAIPIICLLGAGISTYRRCQRKRLLDHVATSQATDVLNGMKWQEFEMLVGESFRQLGYQVAETGGGAPLHQHNVVLLRIHPRLGR